MNSLAKKLTIKKNVWKQVARKSVVSILSVLMTFGQSGLLVLTTLNPTAVTAATGPNVLINEIMPNSISGSEWVELFNAGDEIQDLTGWSVVDDIDQTFNEILTGSLNPGEYLVLEDSSILNNGGDSATLKDNLGNVVDTITYTNSIGGQSMGRQNVSEELTIEFLPSAVSKGESNRCEVGNGEWCASDLVEALDEAESGDTVDLLANISIDEQANLGSGVTLDGNGYTLSASFPKTSNSNNAALGIIGKNNVGINNLIVDGTGTLPWPEHLHGINIYESTNVTLNSVTAKNFSATGVVVNGSEVIANNITTAGNGWHGINVDQGGGVTQPAILTVNGTSNQTDALHIYLDKFATADVTVNDTNGQYESSDNVLKTGDRLYQLKPEPQTVEVSDLLVTHDDAAQNIYVEFAIDNELELTLPTVDQAQIVALYTNLNLALESEDAAQIEAAVNAIGDDILTEYYYLDDNGQKVYLSTINDNPLVKNKYWTRYLVNSDDSQRYPDHGAGVTTIPGGTYRTNTNPLTGSVAEGWLEEAAGKDVYVTVTILSNGEIRSETQSVKLPEPPDTMRPEVKITSIIEEYYNKDFSIDIEATDGESGLERVVINLYNQDGFLAPCINVSGNGAASRSVSCEITVENFADGEYYIKSNALDQVGNRSSTIQQSFKIDTTDPVVNIDDPNSGMILPGSFGITGTWTDAFSGIDFIRVWVNRKIEGSFAGRIVNDERAQVNEDGTFLYKAKNIPSGNYDLKINGVDNAGNDDFASNVNITVDADRPEVEITSPLKDSWYSGNIELRASVQDDFLKDYRYAVRYYPENEDGSYLVFNSGKIESTEGFEDELLMNWDSTTSPFGDGKYRILVEAYDQAGNRKSDLHFFYVDNSHPEITDITYLREGEETTLFAPGDQMTIRVTTEDENDVTRVQYWARKFPWDGSSQLSAGDLVEVSENVWEKTITVPSEYTNGDNVNEELLGNYVNFRPFDEHGNSHIGWRENFTIDATGPQTTITGPENGFNSNKPVTITGVTTDPNGVAKVIIEARAEGEADYSIPVAEITEFSEDGSWSYTWTPDSEGLYDLRAYGQDSLGNLEMTDYIDNLVYDLTAPSAPELVSPRNMWIQGKAALTNTWSAVTDNLSNSVTYLYRSERTSESINPGSVWQGEYGVTSKTASESAISGMNGHIFTWMVRAVDAAGNMSPWSDSRTIIIDTEAPELTINPIQTPTYSKTISGTAIDENGIRRILIHYKKAGERGRGTVVPREYVSYDDVSGNWTAELPIEESGEYEIRVKARDMARPFNESEQQVFNVMLDFAKPEVTWIAPGFQTYSSTNSIEAFVQVNDNDSDIQSVEFKINRIDGFWGNYVDWVIDYNPMWHEGDGVYSYDISYLNLSDDIYRFEVRVTDKAGNQILWPFQEVIIDSIAPEIILEGVTTDEGRTYEPGVKVLFNEGNIQVQKDGNEYSYSSEIGLSEEGEYRIVVRDNAGNESLKQIRVNNSSLNELEENTVSESEESSQIEEQETVEVPNETPPTGNNLSQNIPNSSQGGDLDGTQTGQQEQSQNNSINGGDTSSGSGQGSNLSANAPSNASNSNETASTFGAGSLLAQNQETSLSAESEESTNQSVESIETEEETQDTPSLDEDQEFESSENNGENEEANGLAANMFGFIGSLFASWWFWIILLVGGFLIIFPFFRKNDKEKS